MPEWAAIFDWDGVIADSSFAHEESWRRLAFESGYRWPSDFFKRGFGMKNETIIKRLFSWTDDDAKVRHLSDRKEELYRQIVDEQGLKAFPGVLEWLQVLKGRGISCAVGSSTPRLNISHVVERLNLSDSFSAIVASEDVSYGKPDPEVFLSCAKSLGVSPARCVVFEDTPVGIEAAKAASMKAVAVLTTHGRENLEKADLIVNGFGELSIEKIDYLFLRCCHQKINA